MQTSCPLLHFTAVKAAAAERHVRCQTQMQPAIVDLYGEDLINQAARLLYRSFRLRTDSWPDVEVARTEVLDSLGEGKVSRLTRTDTGSRTFFLRSQFARARRALANSRALRGS